MEGAGVMTDNQYYGILKMVLMLSIDSATKEDIEKKLEALLRDSDMEDIKKYREKR
ncbi:MAG: hypothetical protein FWG71_00075 [Synergistaceae bacterium]|nr:hypothetical protein [Synergistaceae bacterium]